MGHLSEAEIVRATGAGQVEVEHLAVHLADCPVCRALTARVLHDRALPAKRTVPLRPLLELAAFERKAALERLLARAEFADLRRQSRAAQRERVIHSRACHTPEFIDILIGATRARHPKDEVESLANLAILAVRGLGERRDSAVYKQDLFGTIWTETANARRIHGEWPHAQAALERAEHHLDLGSGSFSLRARWLSVSASLHADQGARTKAMAALKESLALYDTEGDWPLVARTLVQMAHCMVEDKPARALALLDRALASSFSDDPTLRWIAASIRAECLVTMGRVEEALAAFHEAEHLRPLQQRPNGSARSAFSAARLLEALDHLPDAEALFDEALAGDLEAGVQKDALLDLLYIFGFHVRRGEPEQAAERALRTLAEIERQGTVLHDQLRSVWTQLIEAARGRCLSEAMIQEAGAYLRMHWRSPAAAAPILAAAEEVAAPVDKSLAASDESLVAPLLARALWSRIRREARRRQQELVRESPGCHTRAFAELLLGELRAAASRDEAEFTGSLALRAAEGLAEPAVDDFLAEVWTEVANVRRIAAEWQQARAALRRAEAHLAHGAGNPLLKARLQSVAASLAGDEGRRGEALQILVECEALYEGRGAGRLLARTLVQMAHTLVEREPARALALAEKALYLIPIHDPTLQWLAESIRTESLIEMGEVGQALQVFQVAESMRGQHPRADADYRSDYTAARLLEASGHPREAEQLFNAVIAVAFDREAYREAFLDILYLFGVHLRHGATEKATDLCRLAIERLDLFEIGHHQLRAVWIKLRDAAMRHAIHEESLAEVREFLKVHWKTPAPKAPQFSFE